MARIDKEEMVDNPCSQPRRLCASAFAFARHLARLRRGPGGRRQGDSLGCAARSPSAGGPRPGGRVGGRLALMLGDACKRWRASIWVD